MPHNLEGESLQSKPQSRWLWHFSHGVANVALQLLWPLENQVHTLFTEQNRETQHSISVVLPHLGFWSQQRSEPETTDNMNN
jgi:hypothetical protein